MFKSRPDRYVALFGEFLYDPSKWRPSVPFVEQLRAFQELIDEGKVMYFQIDPIMHIPTLKSQNLIYGGFEIRLCFWLAVCVMY